MTRTNSKLELESEPFSVEHELPAVEDSGNTEGENAQQAGTDANTPASRTETEKLKAERDALLDRLTRMQAEFENSRKRSAGNSGSTRISPWPARSSRSCPFWIALTGHCRRPRRT